MSLVELAKALPVEGYLLQRSAARKAGRLAAKLPVERREVYISNGRGFRENAREHLDPALRMQRQADRIKARYLKSLKPARS